MNFGASPDTATADCWRLLNDTARCPGQGQWVDVVRTASQSPRLRRSQWARSSAWNAKFAPPTRLHQGVPTRVDKRTNSIQAHTPVKVPSTQSVCPRQSSAERGHSRSKRRGLRTVPLQPGPAWHRARMRAAATFLEQQPRAEPQVLLVEQPEHLLRHLVPECLLRQAERLRLRFGAHFRPHRQRGEAEIPARRGGPCAGSVEREPCLALWNRRPTDLVQRMGSSTTSNHRRLVWQPGVVPAGQSHLWRQVACLTPREGQPASQPPMRLRTATTRSGLGYATIPKPTPDLGGQSVMLPSGSRLLRSFFRPTRRVPPDCGLSSSRSILATRKLEQATCRRAELFHGDCLPLGSR